MSLLLHGCSNAGFSLTDVRIKQIIQFSQWVRQHKNDVSKTYNQIQTEIEADANDLDGSKVRMIKPLMEKMGFIDEKTFSNKNSHVNLVGFFTEEGECFIDFLELLTNQNIGNDLFEEDLNSVLTVFNQLALINLIKNGEQIYLDVIKFLNIYRTMDKNEFFIMTTIGTFDKKLDDLVSKYRAGEVSEIEIVKHQNSFNYVKAFLLECELVNQNDSKLFLNKTNAALIYELLEKSKGEGQMDKLKIDVINSIIIKLQEVSKKMSGEPSTTVINEIQLPYNRIVFGAPGTGKSYKINKGREKYFNIDNYERVTFHPNYSYSQFVGTYKPKPSDNDHTQITYEFVPGPFLRLLVKAYRSIKNGDSRNYLLIIEEINRANVAAVFGDVFQLLDRKEGISEYSITTSEDMRKYFEKEFSAEAWFDAEQFKQMVIPSNLYIWSTMNTADQGVFPMDAAFKRRWDFQYLCIDEGESEIKNKPVRMGETGKTVEWNELRHAINDKLIRVLKVNEDKLIGPFFLGLKCLDNSEEFDSNFKNKLLMYLYEDVVKHRKTEFFECDCSTYSNVCEAYTTKGDAIFGFDEQLVDISKKSSKNEGSVELSTDGTDDNAQSNISNPLSAEDFTQAKE